MSSKIRSMIPVNGPSFGRRGGLRGDTPAAPRTTASCVPSCGPARTPARPRGCSFPRHDTPAGPARTSPPDTSPRLPVRATLTEGYTRSILVRHSRINRRFSGGLLRRRSQVPGFGDVMTKNLLDWRVRHGSRFRYNPARSAQDIGDENRLRGSFASRKGDLAVTITNGLNVLRSKKAGIEALPARANNDQALLLRLEARLKAERDLELLGAPVPHTGMGSMRGVRSSTPSATVEPGSAQPPIRPRSNAAQNVPNCPRCGSMMRRRSGRHG